MRPRSLALRQRPGRNSFREPPRPMPHASSTPPPRSNAVSQQNNLRTVQEIYDAVARGDVAAIQDRVTDDVDWSAQAASTAAPWYGQRTGKAGVVDFFADLAQSIEISEFT